MISIITPTYNTPRDILAKTWASIKRQTYTDWEWVIWDDSSNQDTWNLIYGFCSDERYRVRAHRSMVRSGSIGEVKRNAFMVAQGDILLELDHDDQLTPDCLQKVAEAFDKGAKFVYSDWCEILPSGESGRYPSGWAFGYGSDYWDEKNQVWGLRVDTVNRTTLNHIVSAPNHVRAWDAKLYRNIGGHNPSLVVADDYELVVRTALATTLVHIPEVLYIQNIGGHTAQRQRNGLIQQLVAQISESFKGQLDDKYGPLG
jgi:glycosyltransferase involved in cell wall biosynthesis